MMKFMVCILLAVSCSMAHARNLSIPTTEEYAMERIEQMMFAGELTNEQVVSIGTLEAVWNFVGKAGIADELEEMWLVIQAQM